MYLTLGISSIIFMSPLMIGGVTGMKSAIRVQILDSAVCVSHRTVALRKEMNPQLCENSRTDWDFKPWLGNQSNQLYST